MNVIKYLLVAVGLPACLCSCFRQHEPARTPQELAGVVVRALQNGDADRFVKFGFTDQDEITCIRHSNLSSAEKKERIETLRIATRPYGEFLDESWRKNFSDTENSLSWPSLQIKDIELGEHILLIGIIDCYKRIFVHLDNGRTLEIKMAVLTERGWLIQRCDPLRVK